MNKDTLRFGFGANWQNYVDAALTPGRIERAAGSLRLMLGAASPEGRTFLDIGCGSGLFSLAACRLGAAAVVSFDYDPVSVMASLAPALARWRPRRALGDQPGSVLDDGHMARLDSTDVVYSWGVLHHTGSMWPVLEAAAAKVRPGGFSPAPSTTRFAANW